MRQVCLLRLVVDNLSVLRVQRHSNLEKCKKWLFVIVLFCWRSVTNLLQPDVLGAGIPSDGEYYCVELVLVLLPVLVLAGHLHQARLGVGGGL